MEPVPVGQGPESHKQRQSRRQSEDVIMSEAGLGGEVEFLLRPEKYF